MNHANEVGRRAAYEQIKHSTEMEGGSVHPDAEHIIEDYIAGAIDEQTMIDRIGRRFVDQAQDDDGRR